jgi:hypothetical protein
LDPGTKRKTGAIGQKKRPPEGGLKDVARRYQRE